MRQLVALLACLFAAYGCGSSASPDGDTLVDGDAEQSDQSDGTEESEATSDGDTEADGDPIEPDPDLPDGDPDEAGDPEPEIDSRSVEPPSPPRFSDWVCPDRWNSVPALIDETGAENLPAGMTQFSICLPPDLPDTCPDGMFATPGDSACRWVGDPCPEGDWPERVPSAVRTLYVEPGGNGDGSSRDTPLGTINAALSSAGSGTLIVLAKGTYRESVSLQTPVTLFGTCARDTIVEAPNPLSNGAALTFAPGGAGRIENVTLSGERIGLKVLSSGESTANGIIVANAKGVGIWVTTRSRARITNALVRDMLPGSGDGMLGRGIAVAQQAALIASNVMIDGVLDVGLFISNEATSATFENLVVRNTHGRQGSLMYGRGVQIQSGADVILRRFIIAGNREIGVAIFNEGTGATFEDGLISGTLGLEAPAYLGTFGRGMAIQLGAQTSLNRVVVDGNHETGLDILGPITTVDFNDLVVRGTLPQASDRLWGRGINIEASATVTGSRLLLDRNRDTGLAIFSDGTGVTLTDVAVRDTRPIEANGRGGRGINMQMGASLVAERILSEGSREVGIGLYQPGTTADISDVTVSHTLSRFSDGSTGRGINVQDGAALALQRGALLANRDGGLYVSGLGTVAEVSHLTVLDTTDSDCMAAPAGDPIRCLPQGYDEPVSPGVCVYNVAALTLDRFLIQRNHVAGVQIARDGQLDLSNGEVSFHEYAVNVMVEGYDLARLQNNVLFIDNRQNLASRDLPISDPTDTLDSVLHGR